jgi:hypothetical protein
MDTCRFKGRERERERERGRRNEWFEIERWWMERGEGGRRKVGRAGEEERERETNRGSQSHSVGSVS